MTNEVVLRDYQLEAITAVRADWASGIRRPAIILPTGTGKTVVFARIARDMRKLGVISLVLAHRIELIEQAAAKLARDAPDLRVGIVKGTRREIRGRDVIVASVQSLTRPARRAELAAAGVRLVIVDECHHAVAKTYMDVLGDLGCFSEDPNVGAYALGVTATMGRGDRVSLGQAWQHVAYTYSIIAAIRAGHLVNARGIRVRIDGLDFTRVKRQGGDFQDKALADAMHASLAPKAIARAYVEHAAGRPGVLFAPGVAMAHEIAEAFRGEGIRAVGLDGKTPPADRRRILAEHAAGVIEVVCNDSVLTEGWDAPWVSAVVMARPTSSATLYTQMAGRGLRPHPGKSDCLVIDVVGVTGRHRLATIASLDGADRVEELDEELALYEQDEEIDLLGLLDPGEGGSRREQAGQDGPLVAEMVDLFGASRMAWLRTGRGVWFVPCGDMLVFLTPDALRVGRYRVATWSRVGGGAFVSGDLDFDSAMSLGERHAGTDNQLARRSAKWRAGAPSQRLTGEAQRWGVDVTLATDRGELSDALSVAVASARLDSMACVSTVTERGYW